jgi:hypothetical protein
MKGLTMGDWSMVARFLKDQASGEDLKQFDALVKNFPNLRMELDWLGREINTPRPDRSTIFKSDQALQRLTRRFEQEDLI